MNYNYIGVGTELVCLAAVLSLLNFYIAGQEVDKKHPCYTIIDGAPYPCITEKPPF